MVSIIIPAYNREDYISETLDSVLSQTYPNWECIIVDDGSKDRTEEVISRYLVDTRFRFYHRPTEMLKGANSCRNYGFLQSRGKFIKFLDSDDLLTGDCLEKQVEILQKNARLNVCLSYGQFFNDKTKVREELWSRNKEFPDLLYGHITNIIRWQTADPLWRKSFFEKPPFKEGLMNSQEWLMHGEAFVRLKDNEIYNLKETFTFIRRGNERMSSIKSSNYYKNQKRARIYLLKKIAKERFSFGKMCQLFKQILVFQYWEFRQQWKKK